MKKIVLLGLLALFTVISGVQLARLLSTKYTYDVGHKFCVENRVMPRFNALVLARFKQNGTELYVVGPDFPDMPDIPPQFMSVIPTEALDYWASNCK